MACKFEYKNIEFNSEEDLRQFIIDAKAGKIKLTSRTSILKEMGIHKATYISSDAVEIARAKCDKYNKANKTDYTLNVIRADKSYSYNIDTITDKNFGKPKAIPSSYKSYDEIKGLQQQQVFDRINKESNTYVNEDGDVVSKDDLKYPKSNNTNDVQYQLPQGRELEEFVASEKTIRDLAARMSDRIGIPVRFESDRTKEYKGKIKNNTAYINLVYATLDTPIHEILGHPIIRAIKNRSNYYKEGDTAEFHGYGDPERVTITKIFDDTLEVEFRDSNGNIQKADLFELTKTQNTLLYQNLLKELEYGKGAEVFDRIKRDYVNKEKSKSKNYNLIDKNNNSEIEIIQNFGNYWFKEYNENLTRGKQFNSNEELESLINKEQNKHLLGKYTLEEQQEEAIVELLGLYTAGKLDNVKDGKLISLLKRLLKEMKAFMRSLIGQKEVEIDKLPDNMTLGDIADLLAYSNSKLILPGNEVVYTTPDNQQFKTYQEASNHISELAKSVEDVDLSSIKFEKKSVIGQIDPITNKRIKNAKFIKGTEPEWSPDDNVTFPGEPDIFKLQFDDGSSNTVYDEDLFRNYNEEVNQFYGQIRPFKNTIENFIQKNKEYEQSKEIIEEWKKVNNIQYNPEEIYSRGQEFSSVVGAYSSFDVNLMMQNLLHHIEDNEKAGGKFTISAYTKPIDKKIGHLEGGGGKIKFKIYPKSEDILWASNTDVNSGSVWDASEKISKNKKSELLGVSYTKYPSLRNVNTVQPNLASIIDNLSHHHNELAISLNFSNFEIEVDEDVPYQTKKIISSINKILEQKRNGKLVKHEIKNKIGKKVYTAIGEFNQEIGNSIVKEFNTKEEAEIWIAKEKDNYEEQIGTPLELSSYVQQGVQPKITNETLKESIESVKSNLLSTANRPKSYQELQEGDGFIYFEENGKYFKEDLSKQEYIEITKEEYEGKKEYTEQALINTKIAKLKEVAKKYPRSLIRSEVKPINFNRYGRMSGSEELFDKDDFPFQKIPSQQIKPGVEEVFKSNTELANIGTQQQYSDYLDSIFPDSKIKDVLYHGTTEDKFLKYDSNEGEYVLNVDILNPNTHVGTLQSAKDRIQTNRFNADSLQVENSKDLIIPVIVNSNPYLTEDKEDSNEDWNNEIKIARDEGFNSLKYVNIKEDVGSISYLIPESNQIHILGSKQDINGFKKFVDGESTSFDKNNQGVLFSLNSNTINYILKSVDILSSDKGKQIFDKGKKNNWSLDKILSELQVPKEQKQLLLALDITDREQITLELATNYSYTVEINTAKHKNTGYGTVEWNNEDGYQPNFDEPDDGSEENAKYYSNLTVPGGTNYTENEIATPAITPSIKGHAQFASGNGIGWFRSDDKIEFLDKEDLIKKGIIKQVPCG
jgi:hypothetical protein